MRSWPDKRRRRAFERTDPRHQQPGASSSIRGVGPTGVLYVSGRQLGFKFLARALEEDQEVELLGLVRIAVRQPSSTFRNPQRQATTPPCLTGSIIPTRKPVEPGTSNGLIRLGPLGEGEVRGTVFPKPSTRCPLSRGRPRRPRGRIPHADQQNAPCGTVQPAGRWALMLGGPDSFADGSMTAPRSASSCRSI